MIATKTDSRFRMTILLGIDDGQTVDVPDVRPGIAAAREWSCTSATATRTDDADLWDAETRLLLDRVDGAEALEFEALVTRNPPEDCV